MNTAIRSTLALPLLFACSALLATALTTASNAQDWTRFRGPNGTGLSPAKTVPAHWTADDYNWRVALPGKGFSSPVIWENKIFVTSIVQKDFKKIVRCMRTSDGGLIWQRELQLTSHPKWKDNCDDSASPTVDRERLYLSWATPEEYIVVALNQKDGSLAWRRNLGPWVAEDGFASSPILVEDTLILANDQDEGGNSSLIALDRTTGETRWKNDRRTIKASFSTPCLYQPADGPTQLIVISRANGMTSVEPRSGKINWEIDLFKLRTTGSPLAVGGLIFASAGGGTAGKEMYAVRPGDPSTGAKPRVAYEIKGSLPYVITPVAKGRLLFTWSDRGVATCLDIPSGKVHWQKRIGGTYLGSPVIVDDRLYCIEQKGQVIVLAASHKFEELARVDLAEPSNSTPAIAQGVMYLRTFSHLISLGGGTKTSRKVPTH